MKDNIYAYSEKGDNDNRVCLFYVADKLVRILDMKSAESKEEHLENIRREVEEFKQEIFHNIGANAVHDHNNQEKEMSKFKDWVMEIYEELEDHE